MYIETTSAMMREWYYSFLAESKCKTCNGDRLSKEVLSILINGVNISDLCKMPINEIMIF